MSFASAALRLACCRVLAASLATAAAGALCGQRAESRGYVTTPGELRVIAEKAVRGVQPYKDAVLAIKHFANTGKSSVRASDPHPGFWPYGEISGRQDCSRPLEPPYLGHGSPLAEAKAIVYHLTGDARYAADARRRLLDLLDTRGYGEKYSGANQCILNLSWYLPGWIIAADLIEGYEGWTATDKTAFQKWLATEVYKKVDWASDRRSNNWGSAASATAAMIADYLTGSSIRLIDWHGKEVDPKTAYTEARQRQLDRMNGNTYMDNYNCGRPVGIRPDGGIPEELARGSTGCDGRWIRERDPSWFYTHIHLQGLLLHAELLLRRGDNSIYENLGPSGIGSLLRAILFQIQNPNDPKRSVEWRETAKQQLELAYRHYRDRRIAEQLRINPPARKASFKRHRRHIGGPNKQMLHFGTITHGFASGENPGQPPVVPPPGAQRCAT